MLASFFYCFLLHLAVAECDTGALTITRQYPTALDLSIVYYDPTEGDWKEDEHSTEIIHTVGIKTTYKIDQSFEIDNASGCDILYRWNTPGIDVEAEFPDVKLTKENHGGLGRVSIEFSYEKKVIWETNMGNRQEWTLECYSKDDLNKKASVIIPVTFTKVCESKTTGYVQKKVTLVPETYTVSEAPITVDIPVWTL